MEKLGAVQWSLELEVSDFVGDKLGALARE